MEHKKKDADGDTTLEAECYELNFIFKQHSITFMNLHPLIWVQVTGLAVSVGKPKPSSTRLLPPAPVGRCRGQGGILTRCPNPLIWLLYMWRSIWVSELLTLSPKESPDSQRRKLISATYICDLLLSVTTNSS